MYAARTYISANAISMRDEPHVDRAAASMYLRRVRFFAELNSESPSLAGLQRKRRLLSACDEYFLKNGFHLLLGEARPSSKALTVKRNINYLNSASSERVVAAYSIKCDWSMLAMGGELVFGCGSSSSSLDCCSLSGRGGGGGGACC